MSPGVVGLLVAAAVLLWASPGRRAPRGGTAPARRRSREVVVPAAGPRRAPAVAAVVLAGAATAVVVGGPVGVAAGGVLAVGFAGVLSRLEPAARRRQREALQRQAPLAIDLVAACLASGAPLESSLEAAARAVGPPASEVLAHAVAALRLGADPGVVWDDVARHEPLDGLARAVSRSQRTGAPLSALLPRVAEQARAAHRAQADARIRTAAVRLTAPLGLAFLPAFVLLGVVPLVASWVGRLL